MSKTNKIRFFRDEKGAIAAALANEDVIVVSDGSICYNNGRFWHEVFDVTESDLSSDAIVTLLSRIRYKEDRALDTIKTRELIGNIQEIIRKNSEVT